MSEGSAHYEFVAFQYIHQNAFKAGLVKRLEDWPYSSFVDFAGLRNGKLCDQIMAEQFIAFNKNNFMVESYKAIDGELIKKIFD